jgi:WD40 repeat protein
VAFSADGKRLASAGEDKTVKVWDAQTGQEQLTLKGHADRVYSVAFSPDGKRIASASWDMTVKVWEAQTGQEQLTLKGHAGRVHSVAFSPDGKRLASAGDGTVRLWDADAGQQVLALQGHTDRVWSVAFSPDGKRLASGGYKSGKPCEVKVWGLAGIPGYLALWSRLEPTEHLALFGFLVGSLTGIWLLWSWLRRRRLLRVTLVSRVLEEAAALPDHAHSQAVTERAGRTDVRPL